MRGVSERGPAINQGLTPELGHYKGCVGSCPQILRVSAVSPGFSLVLDTRCRLGGKAGSAGEDSEGVSYC